MVFKQKEEIQPHSSSGYVDEVVQTVGPNLTHVVNMSLLERALIKARHSSSALFARSESLLNSGEPTRGELISKGASHTIQSLLIASQLLSTVLTELKGKICKGADRANNIYLDWNWRTVASILL